MAGIRAEDEIIIFGFFLCPVWEGRYALGGVHSKVGKVESYWLVKKNYFTTIQVAGRMRVMLDSFEDWYAGQFHYKKVDGTPPGAKWRHTTMSVLELAELLGLKSATAYDLVKRAHLETMIIDRRIRVVNDSFESWYAGQNHYIKIAERSC